MRRSVFTHSSWIKVKCATTYEQCSSFICIKWWVWQNTKYLTWYDYSQNTQTWKLSRIAKTFTVHDLLLYTSIYSNKSDHQSIHSHCIDNSYSFRIDFWHFRYHFILSFRCSILKITYVEYYNLIRQEHHKNICNVG